MAFASLRGDWQGELQRAHRRSKKNEPSVFPEVITETFLDKISDGSNPMDPIGLQVLVSKEEASPSQGAGTKDPVGERSKTLGNGLLQKYKGRVLLLLSNRCPVHCRYCFRRHFPYRKNAFSLRRLAEVCRHLQEDPSIREVILSGGDPLSASDFVVGKTLQALHLIGHVQALRIHSRYPTALPGRFTESLMEALSEWRRQKTFVSHINHPRELGSQSKAVFERLRAEGWTLLNQSVLLKGVNDDQKTLFDLSWGLFEQGVLPYYLHQLDFVSGAEHFEVPIPKGEALVALLRAELPGYLVPRYVKELPGLAHKTPI